ncbi:MAG: ABC transporter ATP-binding protein [Caldilineaceae bacterium]|nr:ABC transporter ATP-binding protein [Caldilineaceae bacterium]
MTTIVLKELTRRFGQVAAVDHLNLEIDSGELIAFLGPSGCGKTTTLRMIAGLLMPTSGDVLFDGKSVLGVPTEKRGAVMVFQKHLLFPNMSVGDNIGFGLRMRGMHKHEIAARVREMLELVRLPGFENRRAHELSGGQQQRVALARGLIIRPAVLLLDEPLANLDANLRLEMRELIRNIQQELRITSIFVTHDQEEAVMLADRVALMFDGVIQQYDIPRNFYERPKTAEVARFFRNENFIRGRKRGKTVETAAGNITITADCGLPDGPVLLTVRPEEISVREDAAENTLDARVVSTVYMGTYTQFLLEVDGRVWRANGPAEATASTGDNVILYLPPKRTWLLPVE